MSKKLIMIVLTTLFPVMFLAADVDVIDYDVPVSADANLVLSGGPYTDAYWVETDETRGIVILRFQDDRLAELMPCELPFLETFRLTLELSVADIPDAGSGDGLSVLYNGLEIGRIGVTKTGTRVEIPLEACEVSPADEIILVLRGAGPDGMAIASGQSGSGAVLRVVSFPQNGGIDDRYLIEEEVETD